MDKLAWLIWKIARFGGKVTVREYQDRDLGKDECPELQSVRCLVIGSPNLALQDADQITDEGARVAIGSSSNFAPVRASKLSTASSWIQLLIGGGVARAGLGLPITKHLTDLHSGTLVLSSSPGLVLALPSLCRQSCDPSNQQAKLSMRANE